MRISFDVSYKSRVVESLNAFVFRVKTVCFFPGRLQSMNEPRAVDLFLANSPVVPRHHTATVVARLHGATTMKRHSIGHLDPFDHG